MRLGLAVLLGTSLAGLVVVVARAEEPGIRVEWLRGDKSFFLMGSETWAKG